MTRLSSGPGPTNEAMTAWGAAGRSRSLEAGRHGSAAWPTLLRGLRTPGQSTGDRALGARNTGFWQSRTVNSGHSGSAADVHVLTKPLVIGLLWFMATQLPKLAAGERHHSTRAVA